jgi:DNA-binding HxlR family transcriptional regulator
VQEGYAQFCPVALASELLAQRWMPLVVRELCAGATRFNDIRRGIPRIRASLLKQRLDELERAGVLQRVPNAGREGHGYQLTEAGQELRAVIGAIGQWGQRWARDIDADDLDPGWLVWAMHRRLDTQAMPPGRTVIALTFPDAAATERHFWLVCERHQVDVCLKPPGFEADLLVTSSVRIMAEIWRGLRPLSAELRCGRVRVEGATALRRAFPRWLLLSAYASIGRPRAQGLRAE